jgi:hypothetical protein
MIDTGSMHQTEPREQESARRPWATIGLGAALALPALLMVAEVAGAPLMPTLDYWGILWRALDADGSLHARGLITFQNGHPTFIPAMIIYINAAFLGGTNTALGAASIAIAALTLVVLVRALRTSGLSRRRLVIGAVAFAWLVFNPKGLHNFVYGFSGVAWLTANLLVVAAIVLAARGRHRASLLPALLSCACYGTGFAVWPALLAIQWLRRAGRAEMLSTLGLGVAVGATWLAARPNVPPQGPGGGLPSYVQAFLATVGGLWTSANVDFAVVTSRS